MVPIELNLKSKIKHLEKLPNLEITGHLWERRLSAWGHEETPELWLNGHIYLSKLINLYI